MKIRTPDDFWFRLLAGLLVLSLTGCNAGAPAPVVETAPAALSQSQQEQPAQAPSAQPANASSPTASAPDPTQTPTSIMPDPTQAPATIQVTYFTPSQAEGPYYPVQKPDDRDHDLTSVPSASSLPAGQRLLLQGRVYDRNGQPLEGVLIEIWQTDANGIYLHPGDANTARRDPNFQFYGEALTAADGSYSFLTIIPGEYEPRPRHIHVKIKRDGSELLTTQFYFPDDLATGADGIFASAGDAANALLVALQPGSDEQGELLRGERDVVLDLDF